MHFAECDFNSHKKILKTAEVIEKKSWFSFNLIAHYKVSLQILLGEVVSDFMADFFLTL